LRDEIFQDCLETKQSVKNGEPFWKKLAEQWGYVSGDAIRCAFLRERKKRGIKSDDPINEINLNKETTSYSESDDYINIVCSSKRIKTKEDVISEFGIDTDIWKLEKFVVKTDEAWRKDRKVDWHVTEGHVTSGDVRDSGKILLVPLTRIECRFIRKTLEHISLDEVSEMFKTYNFSIPSFKSKQYLPSDEILEIIITDTHLGSDANHSPEQRLIKAITDTLNKIGKRVFDKTYLVLLGDIFHYDTQKKTTTAGTIVTTNGMTPYQVFDLGLSTLIQVINDLVSVSEVEVIFIPGNHDYLSSYTLVKSIEAYFKDLHGVSFDTGHKSRKYRVMGNSLIGWMHGDMPKSRASNWLQVEAREEWGQVKYSEIHSGNFHSQHGKEDGGIILRYVPGLTDIDEWHYDNGYVGAVRSLVSFVWNKEKGLSEIWYSNV